MKTEKLQSAISKRIRGMCKKKYISFYELACESDVPITTLMNILKGNTKNPGISTIAKLCDALDISLAEFFDTDDFWMLVQETER